MESNKKGYSSVDEYISACAPEVQEELQRMRAWIRAAAPEAEEKISYQMPTFAQNGNLVHFAAFAKHIGFYPAASGIENFQAELAGYKSSKGAVQFPLGQPLPEALIRRIVEFRVAENKELGEKKLQSKK
ncbi:iron chaperone [Paenibacillus donghaensis]|uniref:YdhG-like domain-containing protein n=1 Tax=Paenibacillus donghaensis TaxID=414771 RepID=A0A2Z2KH59_9BACL|nr:DUF1801 domain-containing protein [Paenibacillus donghaensis]ASA22510.1 hypothetical protein B9T62_18010 [Paenibacillus donghaensis]